MQDTPSRRSFLTRLLLASTSLVPRGARAQQSPHDQGIGGTGLSRSPNPPGDQGIGGTGVVGTIRRFGSIYVNGLRITYLPDAQVTIDGRSATPRDMRIGHVASAVARPSSGGTLTTSRIAIESELVGTVETVAGPHASALGQTVDLSRIPGVSRPRAGTRIAVFGRRRPDGVIVASLIEPAGDRADKVVGPLRQLPDGRFAIGDLPIRGVAPSFYGARTGVEGDLRFGTFVATRTRDLSTPFRADIRRVVIEDYVSAGGAGLSGGGYAIEVSGRTVGRGGLHVMSGTLSNTGAIHINGLRTTPAFEGRGVPQGRPHFDHALGRPGAPPSPPAPGGADMPQPGFGGPGGGIRERPGLDMPRGVPGGPAPIPGPGPGSLPRGPGGSLPDGSAPGGGLPGRRR